MWPLLSLNMEVFWQGTAIFVAIGIVLVVIGEVLMRVKTSETERHARPLLPRQHH